MDDAHPGERDAFGRTRAEQHACAVPVLREAYRQVRSGLPVWRALQAASGGRIEGEYARRLVRRAIGDNNIPGWDDFQHRTRAERLLALTAALAMAGGTRPPSGGWLVTSKPQRGES